MRPYSLRPSRPLRSKSASIRLRHRLGDLESFAILPGQEPVGFLVVDEGLGFAVEHERAPGEIRNVGQVRQRRRQMTLEDAAGEDLRIAGADRIDEVLVVRIL